MFDLPARPEYFSPDHEAFRQTVRDFVAREITPHASAWDEAGSFPRALYARAASIGLMGMATPNTWAAHRPTCSTRWWPPQELARAGSGGLQASLGSHHIALPPILAEGSAAMQARVLPPVLAGEKIAALAITEPGGGSDVAALATTAVRAVDSAGDHYVVNGEKTFITSGLGAHFLTVAVRTDPANKGPGGRRCLLVDGASPGLQRTLLAKTGGWVLDTARTCVSTSAACRPAT